MAMVPTASSSSFIHLVSLLTSRLHIEHGQTVAQITEKKGRQGQEWPGIGQVAPPILRYRLFIVVGGGSFGRGLSGIWLDTIYLGMPRGGGGGHTHAVQRMCQVWWYGTSDVVGHGQS